MSRIYLFLNNNKGAVNYLNFFFPLPKPPSSCWISGSILLFSHIKIKMF